MTGFSGYLLDNYLDQRNLVTETHFLVNANQSVTATSEAIQQTLKVLIEVVGSLEESATNMS